MLHTHGFVISTQKARAVFWAVAARASEAFHPSSYSARPLSSTPLEDAEIALASLSDALKYPPGIPPAAQQKSSRDSHNATFDASKLIYRNASGTK
jgi:hypothetical protein